MSDTEQIDRHERNRGRNGYRATLKKKLKRQRRREEKRDPENARGKVRELTRGYSS